uniref:NADH-ubiquinone oxidoreductase chain 6 n=1 Tax=Diplectrona hexapetala (nom. nud.) TaxID=2904920 RepID=A0A9E8LNS5_9NEOP|nr:NADH dehydrogenase subunit 6 [Diplectrona hexapetala (nom. nud.)]UZZ43867.1 NADH dehydrogenase subunit 6 [Diplectrona hexapetala (nom. nud.)]
MMKSLMLIIILTLSTSMISAYNPLSMGFMVILQCLLTCLVLNSTVKVYWISYIFYLIMLGGLLILFMYMCSASSNEVIKPNLTSLLSTLMFVLLTLLMAKMIFSNWSIMKETLQFKSLVENLNTDNSTIISKIYNNSSMMVSWMLISYLLISLIVVATLTNFNKSPLRSSN